MPKRLFWFCLVLVSLVYARAEARQGRAVRMALLSDTHTNVKTTGNDAQFNVRFDKAIEEVNAAKVDFVLITGDLTNGGKEEDMSAFNKRIPKFRAPVYFVPGNHDVGHKFNSGKPTGTVTMDRVEQFEKNVGPSFFVKTNSGVRVIGVNSSLFGSGFEREKEMWSFLEKNLAAPADAEQTILFMHYPLFVKNPDEGGGEYWNVEPEPRRRLLGLLKKGGVETVLTGHLHHTLEKHLDGITLFSAPPISFGLPRDKQHEGWTLVTLSGSKALFEFHELRRPDHSEKASK